MIGHLLAGFLTVALLFPRISAARRDHHVRLWSARLLVILNIRAIVSGQVPDYRVKGVMFIANHISWLDVFALNQVRATRFVAKADVRDWPLVGWLTRKTGTLFIERNRRQDTGRVASDASDILAEGGCLCYFPEGTTTEGTRLLPFKGSLLQAAINSDARVWPLAIRYTFPDGSHNPQLAYVGDDSMVDSIIKILGQRASVVELRFGTPVVASGLQRRDLTGEMQRAIAALLHLPEHAKPGIPSGPPA